jgi:hypothetical protein
MSQIEVKVVQEHTREAIPLVYKVRVPTPHLITWVHFHEQSFLFTNLEEVFGPNSNNASNIVELHYLFFG